MINYFNFKKWNNEILITNDIGNYSLLSPSEFCSFCNEEMDVNTSKYSELLDKRFILDNNSYISTGIAAQELERFKWYLRSGTGLFIFVVTNQCNMNCKYCQAQSASSNKYGLMTKEIAKRAVDIALQSSDKILTFEMQGGEPLLNFEVIKYIVEYSENHKEEKTILYSITTNASLLTDDIMKFFSKYNVSVSTSLDGSKKLQQINRPMKNGGSSFDHIEKNTKLLRKYGIFGGAVLTTTKFSLSEWKNIVDTYMSLGIYDLFIRPLTPLGYAKDHWNEIGYSPEEFIAFYEKILCYIIECNNQGNMVRDLYSMIYLRKMMFQVSDNYMELRSPCGATLGQLAFYYDGHIYTCDEGRMIAQMGDDSFCLGNVNESSYKDLVQCPSCKAVCKASILESLPGCSECVYSPYCGVCPATIYSIERSLFSRTYNNYRCKISRGIVEVLFKHLFIETDREIFTSWFKN